MPSALFVVSMSHIPGHNLTPDELEAELRTYKLQAAANIQKLSGGGTAPPIGVSQDEWSRVQQSLKSAGIGIVGTGEPTESGWERRLDGSFAFVGRKLPDGTTSYELTPMPPEAVQHLSEQYRQSGLYWVSPQREEYLRQRYESGNLAQAETEEWNKLYATVWNPIAGKFLKQYESAALDDLEQRISSGKATKEEQQFFQSLKQPIVTKPEVPKRPESIFPPLAMGSFKLFESPIPVVKLNTGELVPEDSFKKLSSEQQDFLKKYGIEQYNKSVEEQGKGLFQLPSGEWFSRELYELETPEVRTIIDSDGAEGYNRYYAEQGIDEEVYRRSVQDYKQWYDSLPEDFREVVNSSGVEGYEQLMAGVRSSYLRETVPISGGRMYKDAYTSLTPQAKEIVNTEGLKGLSIEGLEDKAKFAKLQKLGVIPSDAYYEGINDKGEVQFSTTPKKFEDGTSITPEYWNQSYPLKPGQMKPSEVNTVKLWWKTTEAIPEDVRKVTEEVVSYLDNLAHLPAALKQMSPEERNAFVGQLVYRQELERSWKEKNLQGLTAYTLANALFIVPVAFAGLKGVQTVSALRSMGYTGPEVAKTMALAAIKTPYTIVRHPVETVKAIPKMVGTTMAEIFDVDVAPRPGVTASVLGSGRAKPSDISLGTEIGGEVPAATRFSMEKLERAVIAAKPPEQMQGVALVTMRPAGIQNILGIDKSTHSGPAFEEWLKELSSGAVKIEGREGGLFLSSSGTYFDTGSASGRAGQLRFTAVIDTPKPSNYPSEIAGLKDIDQFRTSASKFLETASPNTIYPGFKMYHSTAEAEELLSNNSRLVPVRTGKPTIFNWVDPNPEVMQEYERLRQQLVKLSLEKDNIKAPSVTEKVRREASLAKDIKATQKGMAKTYKKALDTGTPQSMELDIDMITMYDPLTNEPIYVPHFAVEDVEAKVWTEAEKLALKQGGWRNLVTNIYKPGIFHPPQTVDEQIANVASNLKELERTRLLGGLELSKALQSVRPTATVANLNLVESIPKNITPELKAILQQEGRDIRLYGSFVDQTYTKGKVIAGDLDIAAKSPEKLTDKLVSVLRESGYEPNVRASSTGGRGYSIYIGDTKFADIRDLKDHLNIKLAYGLKSGMEPIAVDGIYMESLNEQINRRMHSLLFPGFGPEDVEFTGPEYAGKLERMKDYDRARITIPVLLQELKPTVTEAEYGKLVKYYEDLVRIGRSPTSVSAPRISAPKDEVLEIRPELSIAQRAGLETQIASVIGAESTRIPRVQVEQRPTASVLLTREELQAETTGAFEIGRLDIGELDIGRFDLFETEQGRIPEAGIQVSPQTAIQTEAERVIETEQIPQIPQATQVSRISQIPEPSQVVQAPQVTQLIDEIAPPTQIPQERIPQTPQTPQTPQVPVPQLPQVPQVRISQIPQVPQVPGTPGIPLIPPGIGILSKEEKETEAKPELDGAVTFRLGLNWITALPPYRHEDIRYTDAPLEESRVKYDRGTPQETLQVIGAMKIYEVFLPLGLYTAHIFNFGRDIEFLPSQHDDETEDEERVTPKRRKATKRKDSELYRPSPISVKELR